MSHVVSVGVLSPSHWLVMARVMELKMKEIVIKRSVEQETVPAGVLIDVKEFFALIVSSIDNTAENILAALNAHIIALHALPHDIASTNAKSDKELKKFSELVSRLNDPRGLADEEYVVAKRLGQFFSQLAIMGSNVTHIELARGSDWWGKGGSTTYFRDL